MSVHLSSDAHLMGVASMLNEDSESSHSQPIEILLVDDHPLVRRLLRRMIESYNDLRVVGEAVNGEEAVLLATRLKPDVDHGHTSSSPEWHIGVNID